MSKQTLKFGDLAVNKKKYASKQATALNLVNTNKIVVSYRVMMVLNILLSIYMMRM